VGTPITYGCIMLDNQTAEALYDLADLGMRVIILPQELAPSDSMIDPENWTTSEGGGRVY
jgi:lipoate synthase